MRNGPSEMIAVWVDQWQLAESGRIISIGADVSWQLTAVDADWVSLLFGDAVSFDLALDAYAQFREAAPPVTVTGRIVLLQAVWCPQVHTPTDGIWPASGRGRLAPVESTSAVTAPPKHASTDDRKDDHLYGFRVGVAIG